MTRAARRFVRPLSFSALTHRRVLTDANWGADDLPQDHLAVVSRGRPPPDRPGTANVIGKLAHGIADDVLTAAWLAATCPRLLAPAMNTGCGPTPGWRRTWPPSVRTGSASSARSADGSPRPRWASGRMSEPADILAAVDAILPHLPG